MPENALPTTPATPKGSPSSTPPGGTPTSATPSEPPKAAPTATPPTSAPSAEPFRFPDTHPVSWARNKTAEEVLQVARGYEEAFNASRTVAPPVAPLPPPATASYVRQFRFPDDDAILTGNVVRAMLQR